MDDIAAAAGVGKGTLFRRFGSRAGLMIVLLDEDETRQQQAFLFGPPPLGPGAPPLDRLLAYGRDRLRFVARPPRAAVGRQPRPADPLQRAGHAAPHHVRMLLDDAGTTGDLDAQADALLALLDADYVTTNSPNGGQTLTSSAMRGRAWRASSAGNDERPAWVLHVDLDQFLASVELRRRPELAGLPVIVGGNGDPTEPRKVVTCASYEAREFGVHAGMPLRTAARRCPDATFLPSDPAAYDAASDEVMGLLRDLGHPLEVWGWDEAYLGADVDDPSELAERIRDVVAAETGLSCSVGISDNKQRAKVATGFGKPAGIFSLTDDELDGGDGRPRGRRAVGRRAPRPRKSLRAWISPRSRTWPPPTPSADVDVRSDAPACGCCCWPRAAATPRSAPSRGFPLAQPCHHLPARPHRPRRNGLGGSRTGARTLDESSAEGRVVTRVAVTVRTATFFTRTKIRKLARRPPTRDVIVADRAGVLDLFELDRPVRLLGCGWSSHHRSGY